MARAQRLFVTDDDGVPPLTIAFGGIKPGSGLAGGPAVGYTFRDRSFVQATAEISIHNYKLLQGRYQSRKLWDRRLVLSGRGRWQDAPQVALFQLGEPSADGFAFYGERRSEVSGAANLSFTRSIRLLGGGGLERYSASHGELADEEDERLPFVPQLPGLGTDTTFAHGFVAGGYDSRPTGDTSRRGTMAQAGVHVFSDRSDHGFSTRAFVAEGEQLIPVARDRGAFAAAARLWLTATPDGSQVPFFLMPTLGGGDFLRGYRTYRFRDRDAWLFSGEFRWAVHRYADAAVFVDTGTVAPTVRGLTDAHMRPGFGIGLRAHTAKSTLFRFDIATSGTGIQLLVGFSSRPSAVF